MTNLRGIVSHPRLNSPLSRREAIQRITLALTVAPFLDLRVFGEAGPRLGFDPNVFSKEVPWSRILTADDKRLIGDLADRIVPADEFGPAASTLGVVDFVDEWISAPYDTQQRHREILLPGLRAFEQRARDDEGAEFFALPAEKQTVVFEKWAAAESSAPQGSRAFFVLRELVVGGYYTTPEGWAALGYVGNKPLPTFEGPPAEVLARMPLKEARAEERKN